MIVKSLSDVHGKEKHTDLCLNWMVLAHISEWTRGSLAEGTTGFSSIISKPPRDCLGSADASTLSLEVPGSPRVTGD